MSDCSTCVFLFGFYVILAGMKGLIVNFKNCTRDAKIVGKKVIFDAAWPITSLDYIRGDVTTTPQQIIKMRHVIHSLPIKDR